MTNPITFPYGEYLSLRDLLRDQLTYISADCTHQEWITIGNAIKSELGDEGFDLFDTWSQQSPQKYNVKVTRSTWKSLESGKCNAGVIWNRAIAGGWKKPPVSKPNTKTAISPAEQALAKVQYIWKHSQPVTSHPYLTTKQIQPYIARLYKELLVIPLYNQQGEVQNVQFIDAEGKKKFVTGASKKGGYCLINAKVEADTIYIAEGFATAATIAEVTKFPVAVAFDAGQLLTVAGIIRELYPQLCIVVCADDDTNVPGNPGITKAREAAKAVNGTVVMPVFTGVERGVKDTDFNDLYRLGGKNAVFTSLDAEPQVVEPIATVVSILDVPAKYTRLDLLRHIDNKLLISQLSKYLHQATLIPESTIFMVGLGAFSSVATRAYVVDYAYSGSLPISLYVCAEQPSGSAKTRVVTSFTMPFIQSHEQARQEYQKQLTELRIYKQKEMDSICKAEYTEEIERMTKHGSPLLFVNNATAEALENSLHGTGGFFSCVSSEQGLFNSIFGLTYIAENSLPNRDIILHGYDNGFYGGLRVSRTAYYGQVTGGVTLFAQNGSIQTVLNTSEGSGLAERFLLLAEPHALGTRDHFNESFVPTHIRDKYDSICHQVAENIHYPVNRNKLSHLTISRKGWWLINTYRNKIEPELADGKRFSHGALRGQAAKIDMSIMKLAANLHLLEGNFNLEINDSTVQSAINIANDLLESAVSIMDVKQITGQSAACQAIVEIMTNKGRPLTEREIILACTGRTIFRSFTGNKSDYIRASLQQLIDETSVNVTIEGKKKLYSLN